MDRREIQAAAVLALPFALYASVALVVAPPTEAQWARADPILGILPRVITCWSVPALGVLLALAWRPKVGRADVVRAAAGVVLAVVLVGVLRVAFGARLPSFVPSEESAGPGPTLNMVAGLGEELLFRLIMLPLVFFALARRTSQNAAAITATIATGLAFALLHAMGPHAGPPAWFVARFVIPGCAMSIAAFLFRTTFVVTAHATAHVLIPMVFT